MVNITIDDHNDIETALKAFHVATGELILAGLDGLQEATVVWKSPDDGTGHQVIVKLTIPAKK